jgi:hypothetical protein
MTNKAINDITKYTYAGVQRFTKLGISIYINQCIFYAKGGLL